MQRSRILREARKWQEFNTRSISLLILSYLSIWYFLRVGLIKNFFCAVKLSACIWKKRCFHSSNLCGSESLNLSASIFLARRYSSKVILFRLRKSLFAKLLTISQFYNKYSTFFNLSTIQNARKKSIILPFFDWNYQLPK